MTLIFFTAPVSHVAAKESEEMPGFGKLYPPQVSMVGDGDDDEDEEDELPTEFISRRELEKKRISKEGKFFFFFDP